MKKGSGIMARLHARLNQSLRREIESIKQKLSRQAHDEGVYENFGQAEVRQLKDKHDYYSLVYGDQSDRERARAIDSFDEWAMSYYGWK